MSYTDHGASSNIGALIIAERNTESDETIGRKGDAAVWDLMEARFSLEDVYRENLDKMSPRKERKFIDSDGDYRYIAT